MNHTQPVGLYLHTPFCAQKCPYCDFYSGSYTLAKQQRWLDAICRNLRALPAGLPVDSVYFGGGTPSLLSDTALQAILETLQAQVSLLTPEITLEANPRTMTDDKLRAWQQMGINRLSVGVQSFSDAVLQALGRRHSAAQAINAIERAAAIGFSNLSLDLIMGLSLQTPLLQQQDLETAASLPVTHISAYLLKIEPNTPFAITPPAMLDEDAMAERYLQMDKLLEQAGFRHYEISNFAKPGCESRHNCKYWRSLPYLGFGPSAHSCYDGKRYAVPPDFDAFCDAPLQPTELTDASVGTDSERLMLALRLAEGISLADYPDARERLLRNAKRIPPHYLSQNGNHLRITSEGWLLSNAILATLLADIP